MILIKNIKINCIVEAFVTCAYTNLELFSDAYELFAEVVAILYQTTTVLKKRAWWVHHFAANTLFYTFVWELIKGKPFQWSGWCFECS